MPSDFSLYTDLLRGDHYVLRASKFKTTYLESIRDYMQKSIESTPNKNSAQCPLYIRGHNLFRAIDSRSLRFYKRATILPENKNSDASCVEFEFLLLVHKSF